MINVLIVDDESISQNYIRDLIPWEEEGYRLYTPAYNGEEARKILDTGLVDIAFLDVFMPGENGVTLSAYIKGHYPRTAMVAISSHDDFDYVREIMKNGAFDYILKHRLNEETIRGALKLIAAKVQGVDTLNRDREGGPLAAWLFGRGPCPFPPGNERLLVSVAKIPLESVPGPSRNTVIPGIISLLENDGNGNITAVFREPDFFVLCVHLEQAASGGKLLDYLARQNKKNRDNLRLIYKLDFFCQDLPPFTTAVIPGQVQRILNSFSGMGEGSGYVGITLTVSKRKILSAFLTERNRAGIEFIFHEIFGAMDEEDQSARLATIRDLGGILGEYAEEKGIPARFDGLTGWAQNKSPMECEAKIRELFRQLMDESEGVHSGITYVSQAQKFLLDHYSEEINLETVAAALNISPSYLSRLYTKETGSSFVDALNRIRVDAAKACILEGINLKQTAALCGFSYYNYFTKVFKEYAGITPTDYLQNRYDKKS